MQSPLPDSSALESGILEDTRPSRLSRVQENVRNLLRNSHFSSPLASSLTTPTHLPRHTQNGLPTPPLSPTHQRTPPIAFQPRTATESPTSSSPTSSSPSSTNPATPDHVEFAEVHFASSDYRDRVQQMAHASALFNTRAVAALDHPDLSDPSLAVYVQHKSEGRRRGAWTRSKKGSKSGGRGGRSRREGVVEAGSNQCLICVLAALLLSAVVATYVVLATTSNNFTATFHILFILGIILATIVFAHTVVRLLVLSRGTSRVVVIQSSHHGRRHHRREHRPPRIMPPQPGDLPPFVPTAPIRVHVPGDDEVRPDSREAEPTATAEVGVARDDWDKDVEAMPNPPPAYGRWRGSVRANPDLLHWQAIPSPVDSDAHELPSPTYEEAMAAQRTGPPSYVTRESPARRTERRDPSDEGAAAAQAHSAEPEMVEGAGVSLGM